MRIPCARSGGCRLSSASNGTPFLAQLFASRSRILRQVLRLNALFECRWPALAHQLLYLLLRLLQNFPTSIWSPRDRKFTRSFKKRLVYSLLLRYNSFSPNLPPKGAPFPGRNLPESLDFYGFSMEIQENSIVFRPGLRRPGGFRRFFEAKP